jgi:ubiquinone/menaquinone biosynthesis C-methylase UbiE
VGNWLRRIVGKKPPTPPRKVSLRDGYAAWAQSYDEPRSALQQIEEGVVAELLPDLRGQRALDVGSGKGRIARLLLARGASQVVAMDASVAMLHAAPGSAALRVAADARALPLRPALFDVATCCLMLGHLPDPEYAIAELANGLVRNSTFVVSLFHPDAARRGWKRTFRDALTGELLEVEHHIRDVQDYVAAIEAFGFRVDAEREPEHEGVRVVYALRAVRRDDSR